MVFFIVFGPYSLELVFSGHSAIPVGDRLIQAQLHIVV